MNKRGAIADVGFMICALLSIAIVLLTLFKVQDGLRDSGLANNVPEAVEAQNKILDKAYPMWDYITLVVFLGLSFVSGLLAFRLRTHPAFFPFALMALILILVFVSPSATRVYEGMADSPVFSGDLGTFPVTDFIMRNLTKLAALTGVIILGATYALNRQEGVSG